MPEHEIAKHTKAIFSSMNDARKSWKQKLGEIIIEILIIVFAITLSLLVERWRENLHNRDIEKQFLTGLKLDLQNDIIQQEGDSTAFVLLEKGWTYLRAIGLNNKVPDKDSVAVYRATLNNTTNFIPNNSRFEALKSSGQLGVIENDTLQQLILDLYQNRIKVLQTSTGDFTDFQQEQLFPFLRRHVFFKSDGSTNFREVLGIPEMQNNLIMAGAVPQILTRYHAVMQQSRRIIDLITLQYPVK